MYLFPEQYAGRLAQILVIGLSEIIVLSLCNAEYRTKIMGQVLTR